jgi:hypothetical protein
MSRLDLTPPIIAINVVADTDAAFTVTVADRAADGTTAARDLTDEVVTFLAYDAEGELVITATATNQTQSGDTLGLTDVSLTAAQLADAGDLDYVIRLVTAASKTILVAKGTLRISEQL